MELHALTYFSDKQYSLLKVRKIIVITLEIFFGLLFSFKIKFLYMPFGLMSHYIDNLLGRNN